MLDNLFARLWSWIVVFFAAPTVPAAVRTRRGAGFMEYALLAAIAVAVFLVLNALFPGFFSSIFETLRSRAGLG